MRFITFISFLLLSFTTASAEDKKTTADTLNGTWVAVKQEMNGKAFPQSLVDNQKLIINDSLYTVVAESTDKGVIRYKGNKMDIYGKEGVNKGQHFTAIYKYEDDLLTICYNFAGKGYPEAFETKDKKMFFLSVFKKEGVK